MSPADKDTARAVEAVTRCLRDNPDADPEAIALDVMVRLRGLGWRCTEARPPVNWTHRSAGSEPPQGILGPLRADLEAKAAAARQGEQAAREAEDAARAEGAA